ncbi:DUF481 domain-containing protein [Carboxylicivirga sp. N1Y90]|uniref:DUF481 domain-containing protein n=1 Tax=Carboxylicivirga fragile TaxID=3417571 RepID=UPI003D325C20|nr:DUF481 domain-containing protein [Marinilabiliaceae bacterium N1Y90]
MYNKSFFIGSVVALLFLFFTVDVFAQRDSLVFNDGDVVVGKIKSMDDNVLVIKTAYSKSDFNIKWDKIREVYTETEFIVSLSNGEKYWGSLKSESAMDVGIWHHNNLLSKCKFLHIVNLNPVAEGFLDRFSGSIDLNFTSTKSRNAKQLNSRGIIDYKTEKWSFSTSYNTIISDQDDSEQNSRSDGSLSYRFFLKNNWYPIASFSIHSNTEQKLKHRFNSELGFGRFFIRNNKGFWGAKLGLNRNLEEYSNETPSRKSWEGFLGTDLVLHNSGDLTLSTAFTFYPGITEKKRYRADFSLDVKYDLPLDFYIRFGGSVNFDNQPADDAGEYDYDIQTGFGWKWNK